MRIFTVFILLSFITLCNIHGQSIRNGYLWTDDTYNVPIQAHGVSIMQHNGIYYMLGNDMTDTYTFKGVNLYSSTDLVNWTFENTIIDKNTNSQLANRERITERPCLLYNAKDERFVVWLKYQNSTYNNNKAAIFHCNTIDGKYTFEKEFFPKGYDSNDCSVFTDDDGSAYFISTNKANKSLNLYKLSDDYMDASEATILFKYQNKEAPVIFKKDQQYFILSSSKTGWEPNQMKYAVSNSLTSGWSDWKNVGDPLTFHSQPTDVITIRGTEETTYLYVGDRWKDPTLPGSKTLIMPLEVGNSTLTLNYTHEFSINTITGQWEAFDDNTYIPTDNWTVQSVSSEQPGYEAQNAFDGNLSTLWHTNWDDSEAKYPYELTINFNQKHTVSGMMYIPRHDNNPNGNIKEFQLFLSEDGIQWHYAAGGYMSYQSEIYFAPQNAQYMKFISRSEIQNAKFSSAAEIRLMSNDDYQNKTLRVLYRRNESGTWGASPQAYTKPGETFEFGIPPNIYGSYAWTGPSGFYSNSRIAKISTVETRHNGVYTLAYMDEAYNCHTIDFQLHVKGATSNENTHKETPLRVYPNPAHQQFYLNLEGLIQPIIHIYTAQGQLVYTDSPKNKHVLMNANASLSKGVYVIMILSSNRPPISQKLILK